MLDVGAGQLSVMIIILSLRLTSCRSSQSIRDSNIPISLLWSELEEAWTGFTLLADSIVFSPKEDLDEFN